MLNLAFLLDITGSMSCELDGIKDTVARLVSTAFTDHAKELVVTIITFTENERGCYVTSHSFDDGPQAAVFVSAIKLCVPPGMPRVNASGGDGPENHKAALAELLLLDASVPTVAFLITDALPHLAGVHSQETRLEKAHLVEKHGIANSDLFAILNQLHAHYEDNLVLSVLKYNRSNDHSLYGAVAKAFNGVLITPQGRTARQLANGLMAILTPMFRSISGAAAADDDNSQGDPANQEALRAFQFFDLDNIEIPQSEQGRQGIAQPSVGSTDALLSKLVERATVITGGKFKKRAITSHLVCEQVELLCVLAKGLLREVTQEEAYERTTLLLGKIKGMMGEEHCSQFKLTSEQLQEVLASEKISAASDMSGSDLATAVSAITLMTVEETARDLSLDDEEAVPRDPYTSLLTVASLFLGHLSVLELPVKMGVVDFMDAWSATIKKVSNDVISAADFLTMIGDKDSVAGLSLRSREYNFLQLVADPEDAMGSELLKLASGTQVLDILTALLSGAPAGLFSPNMFRGTISACLMSLLSIHGSELSEFQWGIANKMVYTVRLLMGMTPTTLTLEPESAMGKLLFRLLRLTKGKSFEEIDERMVRGFLEEMAAARAQKFAKYNVSGYLDLVESMVGYVHVDNNGLDVFAPHVLLDGETLTFRGSHAIEAIKKSEFCAGVERVSRNILRAVYPKGTAPSLQQIWPSYTHDLPKLLLLQKRTERYVLTESAKGEKSWARNKTVMPVALNSCDSIFMARALALLRQKYDTFVRATRALRADQVASARWQTIVALVRAPIKDFISSLSVLVPSSSRVEHKLLLKALKMYASGLSQNEYEAKVTAVITGRTLKTHRIVFNRGNLHPHPDKFVPISPEFKAKLLHLQRTHKWSTAHHYRESGLPNNNGYSNANPAAWAVKRSLGPTFWDDEPEEEVAAALQ